MHMQPLRPNLDRPNMNTFLNNRTSPLVRPRTNEFLNVSPPAFGNTFINTPSPDMRQPNQFLRQPGAVFLNQMENRPPQQHLNQYFNPLPTSSLPPNPQVYMNEMRNIASNNNSTPQKRNNNNHSQLRQQQQKQNPYLNFLPPNTINNNNSVMVPEIQKQLQPPPRNNTLMRGAFCSPQRPPPPRYPLALQQTVE